MEPRIGQISVFVYCGTCVLFVETSKWSLGTHVVDLLLVSMIAQLEHICR